MHSLAKKIRRQQGCTNRHRVRSPKRPLHAAVWVTSAFAITVFMCHTASGKPVPDRKALLETIQVPRAQLFPPDVHLVKLALTEIEDKPNGSGFYTIIEVYTGPSALKETRFKAPVLLERGDLTNRNPFRMQALVCGDVGVFLISKKKGSTEIQILSTGEAAILNVKPAIAECAHYKRFVMLAELAKELYECSDETRLPRIDSLLFGRDLARAYAAACYLSKVQDPRIVDYVVQLAQDKRLPIEVQMHLNLVLREGKKDWRGSREECDFATRWFAEPRAGAKKDRDYAPGYSLPPQFRYLWDTEEEGLGYWFSNAANQDCYTARQILDWATLGESNPARSAAFKERLTTRLKSIVRVTWRSKQPKKIDEGFSHLVKRTKSGTNGAHKAAAAKLLGVFAPFDEAQTKELRALLAAGPDEAVAAELRALLEMKK